MLKTVLKCFGILFGIEVLLFIVFIAIAMTYDRVPAITDFIYWTLKYPLSFPASLLSRDYPYFLDGKGNAIEAILLSTLNNLILAAFWAGIINVYKRLIKIVRSNA